MSVSFNTIPGTGLVAPIFAAEVNSGGSPYEGNSRLILFGHRTGTGTAALDTPTIVASQAEADVAFGFGSQLAQMYRIARANAPVAEIWSAPVTEAGTAQVWTGTIANLPGTSGIAALDIAGERVQVTVAPADTPTIVAAAMATAINAYVDPMRGVALPLTATAAAGVITLTSRHKGALFAEVEIVPSTDIPNLLAGAGVFTLATGTAGAGVPSIAAVLAALGDTEFDAIVSPWPDTTVINALRDFLDDIQGRWSYARQIYGHAYYVLTGNLAAQTSHGLGRNDRHATAIARSAAPEPSWLWVAGIAARDFVWRFDGVTGNCSRNETGLEVVGLKPPRDKATWWSYASRNTLNTSGMSTWKATVDGKVLIDKLITTYRTGVSGQPDTTFRDIQWVGQLTFGLRFLRTALLNEHGQKAIADDNPAALQAISTVKDIKATLVHAHRQLCNQGVFENNKRFGELVIVERNAGNAARVDVFLPLDRVNPLDIIAVNAKVYSQYASAA